VLNLNLVNADQLLNLAGVAIQRLEDLATRS